MSPSAPRGRPPNIQVTPKREPPQTTLEIKKELASSGRSSDVICVESDDETDTVSRPRKSHRSVAKMEGIVESAMYQARVIHQQAAELVSGAEVYFCIDVFGNSIKVTELRRNGWTVLSVLFFKIPIFVWPFIDASCMVCHFFPLRKFELSFLGCRCYYMCCLSIAVCHLSVTLCIVTRWCTIGV